MVETFFFVGGSRLLVDMERTFIAVKPDGVQRGLCGDVMKRFEQRGFRLVAAKFMQVNTTRLVSSDLLHNDGDHLLPLNCHSLFFNMLKRTFKYIGVVLAHVSSEVLV